MKVLESGVTRDRDYFNSGYLTSVLLGISPNIGTAFWSIHGFDEYVTLILGLVLEWSLPEGPVVATLGFLLGLGLRKVMQSKTASQPPDPDVSE